MEISTTWQQLRFAVPGETRTVVVLAVIAVLLIGVGLRELRSVRAGGRRLALTLLRIATALCAFLCAAQPQWVAERVEHVPGRVAVLLDTSRSMLVREDGAVRLSRAIDAVQHFYDDAHDKPALFAFGPGVSPVTSVARAALDAKQLVLRDETRLGSAIRALSEGQASDLGAILLVSDGADRSPSFDPKELHRLGVRVHTLTIGNALAPRDVAIESVRVDGAAFLRQIVEVEVKLRSTPAQHDVVTVSLRSGSDLLREAVVNFDEQGVGTAKLALIPTKLGRAAYTLSIPTEPDDTVPENNERAFQLEVTRERLRALLVSGHPSWDSRFLRALLKSDPAVDLITFFILRTQNDNSMASSDELSLIPFPTEELFEQHLKSFDLIIFQDFDFAPYQMARYLPRIHDYVLNGGSFAMLGGDRSFGAGGYGSTPIAEILPVTLPERAPFVDEAEFLPTVASEAVHHPLVELAPRVPDNLRAWAKLAPLRGSNIVQNLQPDAHALLVHPRLITANGQPMPVLSVSSPGRGRSLALTTDSAYHWGMATAGRTGDASAYERFWDRALRWLARDPLLDPAHVTTDRASYGPSAAMRVEVSLRDALYRPLSPGPFRLTLHDDHGQTLQETGVETDPSGRATIHMSAPARPAAYTLAIQAEGAAQALAEQGFVVEAGGDELANPRARPDLMQQIADATGGHAYTAVGQLPAASTLPSSRTRTLGNDVFMPFASAWAFASLLLLFGLEWWLRRRAGLR
ncbi:MAG: hypothetical protein RL701_1381 [Pseudomonadota bacterium]|jgi:uncharacterized membrane protein